MYQMRIPRSLIDIKIQWCEILLHAPILRFCISFYIVKPTHLRQGNRWALHIMLARNLAKNCGVLDFAIFG